MTDDLLDDVGFTFAMPGRWFSRAWLAVCAAASDDEDQASIYRRVLVEVYRDGLQLVATDGFWLSRCWVPDEPFTPAPTSIEQRAEFVVFDPDHRMRDLMRYVAKQTKKDDADDIPVTLAQTDDHDPDEPTLHPSLNAPLIAVSIPGETLRLPESEVNFPDWRRLADQQPVPRAGIRLGSALLSRVASAVNAAGSTSIHLDFQHHAVLWSADHLMLDLSGLLMPMRDPDTDEGADR